MKADTIHFKGYRCFQNDWVGFDEIKPINVIIGRNNSGKSNLMDLVNEMCKSSLRKADWQFKCSGRLTEADLRKQFREGTLTGELGTNDWENHGRPLVGRNIFWELNLNLLVENVSIPSYAKQLNDGSSFSDIRIRGLSSILKSTSSVLADSQFQRLFADRDIRPEPKSLDLKLDSDGSGATNIIRQFLNSADSRYQRSVVQNRLLEALNLIFGNDGFFTEIDVQDHDTDEPSKKDPWEVYLGQDHKGLIPLSGSGSGLKTVILVLLILIVIPVLHEQVQGKPKSKYTFAFEELENNLHPALLRRLFQYLETYAIEKGTTIFLTTHSSVALDFFGTSENAQIIHVTHDGKSAKATPIKAHFDKLNVISELGARPSDLLQANGIIWVEGPSDRLYLNRWIEVYSDGKYKEGRDYQCAFYGGALLARLQCVGPQEAVDELVNLIRINPNIVMVCDSDRSEEDMGLKERVKRIFTEVEKIPKAYTWVTACKEIENYLPGEVLKAAYDLDDCPDPIRTTNFFPARKKTTSFLTTHLGKKNIDKVELAASCTPHMTMENMSPRFDWLEQIEKVVERIESWNA